MNRQKDVRLSSEVLEQKFGVLFLEVLSQNGQQRKSCLRRKDTEQAVACSFVEFNASGIKEAPELHAQIVDGGMLGKTINEFSVQHERKEFEWHAVNIPLEFQNIFNNKETVCVSRKIEYCIRGKLYAVITEYYNPECIRLHDFEK